jgi:hypothetical protein
VRHVGDGWPDTDADAGGCRCRDAGLGVRLVLTLGRESAEMGEIEGEGTVY